jgi:bacterial/archaeal transporter family-2 protein
MNWTTTVFAALAAGAGCCIAVQAAANGRLRLTLTGSGPEWAGMAWAAYFSICGTVLCSSVAMLVLRPPFPTKEAFASTQWWNWIGGPLGALIVLAGAALLPQLKAAPFIALVVGGQILCSMVLDHFGLVGLTPQPLSAGKVVGAILVVAGVVCVKWL